MTIHHQRMGLILLFHLCFISAAFASSPVMWAPQEVTRGSLWLRDGPDPGYQPAPTVDTDVTIQVVGMLARVRVRQSFTNPGRHWAEGVYVFPLPAHAAVDRLHMQIGERIIEGRVEERQKAKKIYAEARQAGRRASLTEQERPNIFTSSLANIAPGESIMVEIEYQQTIDYSDGLFRLRFPMLVAPRYIPGTPLGNIHQVNAFSTTGWARATSQVADAGRITPPVQHPADGPINPLRLTVKLDAGIPLSGITSSYHTIEQQQDGPGKYLVRLAEGPAPADRDFELVWRPQPAAAPSAAWFTQQQDQQAYGLLMLLPPQNDAGREQIGRELIFVIDTSGSMHGESIEQARDALLLALNRLGDQDRFNIIRFNHETHRLFNRSRTASANNLAVARRFVRGLEADGGTEMLPALRMALQRQTETAQIRQIVFLTDGSVGNEQELFQLIRDDLDDSRLFTIGIGSAPNSHFMRKAASHGRGTFTYIGNSSEVLEKMSRLLEKLERPALTDIRIELPPGSRIDILPRRIPDLYAGEPLLLALRGKAMPAWLQVQGRIGERRWKTRITLDGGQPGTAIATEWGRRQIAALMTRLHDAQDDDSRDRLRSEIISTALRHHLVSRYTSLVAVDITPGRQPDDPLQQHALKTNLPKGWSYEHIFNIPQTATAAQLRLLTGLALLLLAAAGHFLRRRERC